MAEHEVHAVAHITGGGLPGNLPRVLGDTVDAVVDTTAWEPPRIFSELQAIGDVSDEEMGRVFNMGMGMVIAVPQAEAHEVVDLLAANDRRARIIGELVDGTGVVHLRQ
jgi:phosphoribosylformylglycinamidine cyclo-ligase